MPRLQQNKVKSNNELNAIIVEKVLTILELNSLANQKLQRLKEINEFTNEVKKLFQLRLC
jgi:hypothetical protein